MINQSIVEILSKKESIKKLTNSGYLTDKNNENFKYIWNKFFNKDTEEKVKTLNTGSGLFDSVITTIAYFVGNPSLDFKFNTNLLVKDYLAFGYACVTVEMLNGKWKTSYQPAESYIRKNGVDYIIRAYKKNDTLSIEQVYYLVTSYNGGLIENKLYTNPNMVGDAKEVDLYSIEETSGLLPMINTGLTKCFWVIKDEDKITPMVEQIKHIVYSVDRKIMMFDTQFLQNVESFTVVSGIKLGNKVRSEVDSGELDFSVLGRIVETEADGSIQFVNNTNALIKDAIEYERVQHKKISSITNIPLDFLGGDGTAGAIGEGSRELLHGAFTKRIIGIRQLFDEFITDIIDTFNTTGAKVVDKYSRDDVFSKNAKNLMEELSIALDNSLISRKTAMKKYLDYSDAEVLLEQAQIDSEKEVVEPLPVIE